MEPQIILPKLAIEDVEEGIILPASTVKNNNPDWNCLNREINCKICKARHVGSLLVNHYVNTHPSSEVFPSRVAPDIADVLRNIKEVSECEVKSIDRRLRYKQFCYFCNKSMCYTKCDWILHMIQHTGYYGYKCGYCLKRFAKKSSRHMCEKECIIEKISQPQFEKADLKAFLCDICNYVRFNVKDIEKHLENEHSGDRKNRFKEVIFLTFPEWKKKRLVVKAKMTNEVKIADASQGELICLFHLINLHLNIFDTPR